MASVGHQAWQAGLLGEQLPLTTAWVEIEPRRPLRRLESTLSRQQEALWYPITDVETEADKQDGRLWGGLSCFLGVSITYHEVSAQGALSGYCRQRLSAQTIRHPVENAGGALEGSPGLAAHHVWPTDLTRFRDPLSVARAGYLGGGANQVASFSTLPPASCPASGPTAGPDISQAGPILARGASTTAFQQFPSCTLPGYKIYMSFQPQESWPPQNGGHRSALGPTKGGLRLTNSVCGRGQLLCGRCYCSQTRCRDCL